jgi:hypothetical protein
MLVLQLLFFLRCLCFRQEIRGYHCLTVYLVVPAMFLAGTAAPVLLRQACAAAEVRHATAHLWRDLRSAAHLRQPHMRRCVSRWAVRALLCDHSSTFLLFDVFAAAVC